MKPLEIRIKQNEVWFFYEKEDEPIKKSKLDLTYEEIDLIINYIK